MPTSKPSGRGVQLSLPHFTPVIIHPNAREAPASDWDAAAEEHAAPERTSPTPPAIPNTTMRARRRSGHVVAEMLVAAAGFVTLAIRQTIAKPDVLHTNDTAAAHKFTIKLQWHQTRRSSRLVQYTTRVSGGGKSKFGSPLNVVMACLKLDFF